MQKKINTDEDTHLKLMRLLEQHPNITQRELAEQLGVSLGKTNYCIKALLDKGWLKIQNFQDSKRKLAYAYLLTPQGMVEKSAITVRFLQHKMDEYERLRLEIESLRLEVSAEELSQSKSGML
ncbi:MarR family EPS-associated transcriptional regulator [Undibacterium crateris]|uniref:MarR family EPS-associated transcriptional regulator n=1 Tax=Undibacterium crateris TaxID=2528175 RepID=UPI001389C024|nr:MarR family EPS-associated transcriptional regulator [Undibacterium crateris]NDI84642.1 MarR family EPS-associated transcriptional regulator [Undibacterium crateris]